MVSASTTRTWVFSGYIERTASSFLYSQLGGLSSVGFWNSWGNIFQWILLDGMPFMPYRNFLTHACFPLG